MMRIQQKKRIIIKLWGWGCLSINCLVVSLYLAGQHSELLNGGILFAILTVGYGVLKTQLDKIKGDTSVATIIIQYICVYIITFVLGFKASSYLSSDHVLFALVVTSLAEMLVLLCITYWYTIYRLIFKGKPKKTS